MDDRTRQAVEHLEWMARRHDGLTNPEKGDIQIVLDALYNALDTNDSLAKLHFG